MNNPLDNNEFKHYLRFISLGRTDLYQICEPIGFDGTNFIQEQEKNRYARSVEYGAIDKIKFVDAEGINISSEQTINPQGDISNHLEYGLQWLLHIYKSKGFQGKVEYVLEKNGVQFSGGMLDFTEKNITDGYTYVECKLIQKNKVADLKRRLDDKFNLFGTVNAKNETITPCPSIDFLRLATPHTDVSIFQGNGTATGSITRTGPDPLGTYIETNRVGCCNANKIIQSDINNTLSFLSPNYATVMANDVSGNPYPVPNDSLSFTFLEAKNDLSNVQVEITNIDGDTFATFNDFFSTHVLTGSGYVKLLVVVGNNLETEPFTVYELWNRDFKKQVGFDNNTHPIPTSFNLTIPVVERGKRVYVYFGSDSTATFNNTVEPLAGARINVALRNIDVKFTATETAINTVVKGVRWIDGIKQAPKFASDLTVNASLFDAGGIHYDNVLFNRRGISGFTDNFTANAKTLLEGIEEVNCDYEPDENGIFIGHEKDFYENEEIGYFEAIPAEDFSIEENDKLQINKVDIGYKTFQQDRTVVGTSNAIHTEAEFRLLNDNVESVFERKSELIRDPFTHQATVDLEITQPSTSTEEDDKINIVQITSLAPGSFNEFGARLLMRINAGKLEILNRDSNGDSGNVVINWTILGFSVGSGFQITFGNNSGSYTVFEMTNTVIKLTPIGFTPTFEGDGFIRMKYYYTNVLYVTRTNQGFISNPLSLQNAFYSIHRNFKNYFGERISASLIYEKADIINGYFKSNGTYTSQLTTESAPVIENMNIIYSDLPTPLITAKVYTLNCTAEFEDILAYLEAYKVKRGFVRCFDSYGRVIKGFVQKLDHLWQENKLKLVLEEKYQDEYLEITSSDEGVFVSDYPNSLSGYEDWFRFDNDYLVLYDVNHKPLNNQNDYPYNKIKLNGVVYSAKDYLMDALLSL